MCGKGEIYVCEATLSLHTLECYAHTIQCRCSFRVQAMETNRKVRVTTAELDKWGAHSWDITFLSGDAYTPPGTHNYDPLVPDGTGLVETGKFDGGTCNSAPRCKAPAAVSALLSVTTTQDGSQELGGTFTLFIGTPNPLEDVRVLPFDASPDRIRLELQELSTVDTVFVTRIPYRDPILGDEVSGWVGGHAACQIGAGPGTIVHAGEAVASHCVLFSFVSARCRCCLGCVQVGWNADPVANGRIGGWRLQITFVANPGDFVAPVTAPRSIAFPPGASPNRELSLPRAPNPCRVSYCERCALCDDSFLSRRLHEPRPACSD